jgi:DNA primase large subunit
MAIDELRKDDMMAHLLDSLEAGKDIGHYGRLTFAMVARHYLEPDELISYLTKDPDCDERKARALVHQVESRDYNPPKRERILDWNDKQEFPICPDPNDPDACNIYRNLELPHETYEKIEEYHEQKADAGR